MTRITKKQFQPSITTFLHRIPRDEASHATTSSTDISNGSSSVAIPEQVQASLISVGMRVRKAVPEGYKTKILQDTQTPLKESSGNALPSITHTRELMPFCGIHKIGGYSAQPQQEHGNSYSRPGIGVDDEPDIGFPFSSQESFASTISTDSVTPLTNNKKRFLDNEPDEDDCGFEVTTAGAPLFSFTSRQSTIAERPIAKAVTRRKATRGFGPEGMIYSEDFEDASFLQWDETMDLL